MPADSYLTVQTPLGPGFVAYSEVGVSAVTVGTYGDAFERAYESRFGRPVTAVAEAPPQLASLLDEALAGTAPPGALPVDLRRLSLFGRAVLEVTARIPRGEVRSYSWIAAEIDHPLANRAVGSALARNPVPLVIPCHRVVRRDGRMGDFALGAPCKQALLASEGYPVAV